MMYMYIFVDVHAFIRDLQIYDGDVNENVSSKYHFAPVEVFHDYSISFRSYNVGEVS